MSGDVAVHVAIDTLSRLRVSAEMVALAALRGITFESIEASPTTVTAHVARPTSLDRVAAVLPMVIVDDFLIYDPHWTRSRKIVGEIRGVRVALVGAPAVVGVGA